MLRGNGGGGGDADDATDDDDDDASFQQRFIGSICKALMEPPTLETGSNSFYSPLHSSHTIVFYVQFFIHFFIRPTENECSSRPVIIYICSFHCYAAQHCGILLEEVNSNFRVRAERADERAERTFVSITADREPKPQLFP